MSTSYTRAKAKHEQQARRRAQSAGEEDPGPRTRFQCSAEGCQMAGAISVGSGDWCAFHSRAQPSDLARITSVMNQHLHLRDAITTARNLIGTDKHSHAYQAAEMRKLSELITNQGYTAFELEGTDLSIAAMGRTETFEAFIFRMHIGLGNIINAELSRHRPIKAQQAMETTD